MNLDPVQTHDPIRRLPGSTFRARREELLARMTALGGGVTIVRSNPEQTRSNDTEFLYRPDSDLWWLTGFGEPDTVAVFTDTHPEHRFVLFVRPRDPETAVWDGPRAGLEGALAQYGAEVAYPAADLPGKLWELIANCDELHHSLGLDGDMDQLVGAALVRLRRLEKKGKGAPRAVVDLQTSLHELRLHKGPEELERLRQAAAVSTAAHVAAMRTGRPGATEYELAALIEYTFKRAGSTGPGYQSIVGAGASATILHYIRNDQTITDDALVLVDAGGEMDHYTADITRTWPASGRFTPAQRQVYELVLATQKSAIALARPGATIDQIHDHCVAQLTAGMVTLGLLAGPAEERIKDGTYKRFYMHGTSHWLGLDVHDVGLYRQAGTARPLAPGMVITIEPGLYIAPDAEGVPAALRGIGVRIEDDIAIPAGAPEVPTAACPKEIREPEAARRGA